MVSVRRPDSCFTRSDSDVVGTMVVQLAKAQGAHVVATCSGANAELVKSLGADEVSRYQLYLCLR